MSIWYNRLIADPEDFGPLVGIINHFENELDFARGEVKLAGSIEKASVRLPGIMTHRFGQLQEIEAILRYLEIRLVKVKGKAYKKFLEGYAKALSSRDAEKYADADDSVVELALLINRIALLRNQYLGITKGLESKGFQINNIVKLRAAGMEDTSVE